MKKNTYYLFALLFGIVTSKAQSYQWAKSLGGTNWDHSTSIAVDGSGNVYTCGWFKATADFDPGAGTYNLTSAASSFDIFISKLDAAGNFLWAKSIGGTDSDRGMSIAVDGSGNVYTTGYFEGTVDFDPGTGTYNLISGAESSDIFISKLDSAGNFVWAKNMGGGMLSEDSGYSIALDGFGNVYTTGSFWRTGDFDPGAGISNLSSAGQVDIFISKLDGAGNFLWAKSMGGTDYDEAYSMAVDGSGNVYTTGYFQGTADFDPGAGTSNLTSAGIIDIFISKLDASGNFVWAKSMGGTDWEPGYSIAVDGSGNVYTTGVFKGTVDFDPGAGMSNLTSFGGEDIFISKLDAAGNFLWAKSMGGTDWDQGRSIALDSSGNAYIIGYFAGTVDFDPGAGTSNFTSAGLSDIFISKLDPAGAFLWTISLGGTSEDRGYSIALDNFGNVYSTGFFGGSVDFDPGMGTSNLTSSGSQDIFISKLGAPGVDIFENSFGNTLMVYPNPTNGEFSIALGKSYDDITVIIRNLLGQDVFKKSFYNSSILKLNIPGKIGMYFIEVSSGGKKSTIKAVKE